MRTDFFTETDAEYAGIGKNQIYAYDRGKRERTTRPVQLFLQELKILRVMDEKFGSIS
jgi:hypothetical protein